VTTISVPGPNPQGSHHWVMTISWQTTPGSERRGTWRSTITPEPGQTRADIYEILRAFVMRDASCGIPPTVLFFALEPNALGGAR